MHPHLLVKAVCDGLSLVGYIKNNSKEGLVISSSQSKLSSVLITGMISPYSGSTVY